MVLTNRSYGTSVYYELTQATEATAKGYRDAYNKAYFTRENNKELLVSTHISRFGKFNSWDEWQYIFVNSGNGTVITGGLTPTLEFMEMFPMSNGEPFQLNTATDLFYTDNDYNKPIRDPRLYETMLVNGTQFGDHAAPPHSPSFSSLPSTAAEVSCPCRISAMRRASD